MASQIVEVVFLLPDGHATRRFEQACPLGCLDEKGRPTMFAGATEEDVRQFVSHHRRISQCVERAHRYSQRVQSGDIARKREAKVEQVAAKEAAKAAILAPKKAPPKPSWKNAKKTTTLGWDGKPLA